MAELTSAATAVARPPLQPGDLDDRLRQQVQQRLQDFRHGPQTPRAAYALEKDLRTLLDALGRELLPEEFNHLEPQDKQQGAPRVRYPKATYRINQRTQATIATRFGPLTLESFLDWHPDDGEPGLHPLHVQRGIVAGVTTVLAERVGQWAVEHRPSAVRVWLGREHGLKWSNDRWRAVRRAFRRTVVAFRQEAQVERLLQWLADAERSRGRHRPVRAVGRDGVMVPIRAPGYQEASAATVSVSDRRGRRRGTVYLGPMPPKHQTTLTQDLTTLVTAVREQGTGPLPRWA